MSDGAQQNSNGGTVNNSKRSCTRPTHSKDNITLTWPDFNDDLTINRIKYVHAMCRSSSRTNKLLKMK